MDRDFFFKPFSPCRNVINSNINTKANTNTAIQQPRSRIYHPRWSPQSQLAFLDDEVFDLGHQLAKLKTDLDHAASTFGFGLTRRKCGSGPDCPNWMDLVSSPVLVSESNLKGEDGKFTVSIPLGGNTAPEDLKVSIKDRVMTIEVKKENVSDDGASRVYQEFTKKFTLPPSVDMKEVKSVLTPEGFLKIEARLPQPELEQEPLKKKITDAPCPRH